MELVSDCMCGIVGLFAKSPEVEARLGAHLAAMLAQMSDRGPDSAGVAVYRDPAPPGSTQAHALLGRPGEDWDAVAWRSRRVRRRRRAGGAREPRGHRRRGRRRRGRARGCAARRPDLRVMSAGQRDRDLQGGRPPRGVRPSSSRSTTSAAPTRSATRAWRPRAASRPRASHPFSTGLDLCLVHNGSLSNHNRLRLDAAPRGDRVPDRERHRGRRRLPRVAAARGRVAGGGARGLPRGSRRLLHLPRRHRRRLRRPARPDRVQAGRARRDRRLGRDGVRVPRDRGPAGRRGRAGLGARARRRLRLGAGAGAMARRRSASTTSRSSTSPSRRCASSTSGCTTSPATAAGPRRWRVLNPNGAHAVACGLDADARGRDRGPRRATTAPA